MKVTIKMVAQDWKGQPVLKSVEYTDIVTVEYGDNIILYQQGERRFGTLKGEEWTERFDHKIVINKDKIFCVIEEKEATREPEPLRSRICANA